MRDDIQQRSGAMQSIISDSNLPPEAKAALGRSIAVAASATNGLTEQGKIQAICDNVYQLSENVALLSLEIGRLPCVTARAQDPKSECDCVERPRLQTILDTVIKCKWALATVLIGAMAAACISPTLAELLRSLFGQAV